MRTRKLKLRLSGHILDIKFDFPHTALSISNQRLTYFLTRLRLYRKYFVITVYLSKNLWRLYTEIITTVTILYLSQKLDHFAKLE